MKVRACVRAGTFYDGSPSACRRHAEKLLSQASLPDSLPERLFGGLVPHAGWVFSGVLAARTVKALATQDVSTIVLFGADHVGTVRQGEVFDSGAWRTPLGDAVIDEELAEAIIQAGDGLRSNPEAHAYEHSIEVQIPLIQVAIPGAKILPVAVPPSALAVQIGRAVGKVLRERFPRTRIIGSTDLTHHGGHFGSPGGPGRASERFARLNDQRMLDLITAMRTEEIVPEAATHQNACGAGAIAAAMSACREMGAKRGIVLSYSNSYEVVHETHPHDPDDTTVGYASVVFA